ncbi:hypothetical protein [Gaetbulibacter jejuensis]|uniref:hypothetical protein n=1 Tax=Gaetbulibacter jejuensis TaxID=584607 RepID=UPI00300B38A6
MKKFLIISGIIIVSLEIAIYLFWYKELYNIEFFVLTGLCHFALTSIVFGIMTEIRPKIKRKLIINISFGIFAFLFLIIFLNTTRIQNRIDKEGIYIKGIVVKKEYGAKSTPWLTTNFKYDGKTYKSNLSITDSNEFEKIELTDSVLIKFIKEYPKMNRTEKLLNK